jgi:hypothetical protein
MSYEMERFLFNNHYPRSVQHHHVVTLSMIYDEN